MRPVNCTPHIIRIFKNESMIEIPPSGYIARIDIKQIVVSNIDGIPVVKNLYGMPDGLPGPKEDHFYIVSKLVRDNLEGRPDVVAPDTGPTAIRDKTREVCAVRQFATV